MTEEHPRIQHIRELAKSIWPFATLAYHETWRGDHSIYVAVMLTDGTEVIAIDSPHAWAALEAALYVIQYRAQIAQGERPELPTGKS